MTKTKKDDKDTRTEHKPHFTFIRRRMYGIGLSELEENPMPEFENPEDPFDQLELAEDTTGSDVLSYSRIIRQHIALLDVITFIDKNWEDFVVHAESRWQERTLIAENPAKTNRYQLALLANTLKELLSGTHPSKAFQLRGSRGRPPLSPNNLDAENNRGLFKIYVSGLVKAIVKNDGVNLLEAQIEVASYFSGLGYSENTIKGWYDKFSTFTEMLPEDFGAGLVDEESRRIFVADLENIYSDVLPKPNLKRRES